MKLPEHSLVLAPMDGITDAPMRQLQGSFGVFTHAVSEFIRVASTPVPPHVFLRDVPELATGAKAKHGLPVHVQILGGDAERMAISAQNAISAGASAIDINFGCPAPVVNRNDGGALLLKTPCRVEEIVAAVRAAVPAAIPVSAKLRLGWDTTDAIYENAVRAASAGASWLTIHARTRMQGYQPPVYWEPVRRVKELVDVPVIANGDLWTFDDFLQCRDQTGCDHFMIGRGALANPLLPHQIAFELRITQNPPPNQVNWEQLLMSLVEASKEFIPPERLKPLMRLKQWLKLANQFGEFQGFEGVKQSQTLDEFFAGLSQMIKAAP